MIVSWPQANEFRTMPVVFRHGGPRYYFFSNEGSPREPVHVHVRGGGRDAKVWLEPYVSIADSNGFKPAELSAIVRVVEANWQRILDAWYDHFGNDGPF